MKRQKTVKITRAKGRTWKEETTVGKQKDIVDEKTFVCRVTWRSIRELVAWVLAISFSIFPLLWRHDMETRRRRFLPSLTFVIIGHPYFGIFLVAWKKDLLYKISISSPSTRFMSRSTEENPEWWPIWRLGFGITFFQDQLLLLIRPRQRIFLRLLWGG